MYCSTSITTYFLSGIGAFALIVVAFLIVSIYPMAAVFALIGAMFLLRGCPICWLMGLAEKLTRKHSKTPSIENK